MPYRNMRNKVWARLFLGLLFVLFMLLWFRNTFDVVP
jgi:hypothetical protein